MFSIFDAAAQAYSAPFMYVLDTQAMRAFEATALNENSNVNQFPQDFELVRIGEFDENIGELIPCRPTRVITALEILKNNNRKLKPFQEEQLDIEQQINREETNGSMRGQG